MADRFPSRAQQIRDLLKQNRPLVMGGVYDGLSTRIAHRAGASVFVCSRAQLRARHVRDAWMHDVAVAVYGVNTPRDLAAVRRTGADVLITDYPERMIRALRSF